MLFKFFLVIGAFESQRLSMHVMECNKGKVRESGSICTFNGFMRVINDCYVAGVDGADRLRFKTIKVLRMDKRKKTFSVINALKSCCERENENNRRK